MESIGTFEQYFSLKKLIYYFFHEITNNLAGTILPKK